MVSGALLEVREVSFAYPSRDGRGRLPVLEDVSFSLERGAFGAIVGPSGCGKSTLLNVIAGLDEPGVGSVRVDGFDERLGRVGYMPWRDLLLPWLDAVGNASAALEVKGAPGAEARRVAGKMLRELGIEGFEGARPHELSAGMRQRVAFARTVLASDELVVLDEPFASLDALTRSRMHAWLQEAWPQLGRTGLLVTHDVEEALVLADEVLVLSPRPGRIVHRVRVPFPRPRTTQLMGKPSFAALRLEVLAALGLEG